MAVVCLIVCLVFFFLSAPPLVRIAAPDLEGGLGGGETSGLFSGDLRRRCSVLRESREARAGAAAGKAAPCWPCSARCVGAPHSKNAALCEAPAARRLSLTGSGGGVEGRPRLFLCQQPWELALALGCGSRCRRADVRLRAAVGAPRAWKHGRACNAVRGRCRCSAGTPRRRLDSTHCFCRQRDSS